MGPSPPKRAGPWDLREHLARLAYAGGSCALLLLSGCDTTVFESTYTSIDPAQCSAPDSVIENAFKERDLGVQRCPAPGDWMLLLVSSDANSWIELRRDTVTWSAEESIVYQSPIGNFPGVTRSIPLEWRSGSAGVRALILPIAAQDPKDGISRITRLFVVRLGPNPPCVLARVEIQEQARRIADSDAACPAAQQ